MILNILHLLSYFWVIVLIKLLKYISWYVSVVIYIMDIIITNFIIKRFNL